MDNSDFFNDFDLGDGEYLNSYEDSAADLKFRAIKVDNFNQHDYFSSSSFPGASVMTMGTQFNKFVDVSPVKTNTFESGCPAQPRGMSNKNFIINNSDYASVVRSVSDFITTYNDNLDFSYSPMEHMWRGKFLYGSNCFEVEVNLYSNGPNGYVCAVRNCKCDCACCGTFNAFFNDLKSKLGTEPAKGPARKAFVIPPMCPLMCPPVSPEEFLSGIQPVFCMAKGCWESRIQAAKMLCDVSRKCSTYLSLPAFRGEAVRALEGFVADECEEVRQYAFMAIAAFVEVPAYHELFLCSRILSALFLLIENPADPSVSYETAQVRRQAAAALAHLSRSNAYAVRAGLHQQQCDVVHWMARVGSLQDARTRAAALEIKACLEQVTENMPMSTSDEFPLQSSSIGEESAFAELVR